MTPAEHLTEAERLLAEAGHNSIPDYRDYDQPGIIAALVHAVIALAIESGAPHRQGNGMTAESAATG